MPYKVRTYIVNFQRRIWSVAQISTQSARVLLAASVLGAGPETRLQFDPIKVERVWITKE